MNGFVFLGFKNLSVECHQIYVDYDMAPDCGVPAICPDAVRMP